MTSKIFEEGRFTALREGYYECGSFASNPYPVSEWDKRQEWRRGWGRGKTECYESLSDSNKAEVFYNRWVCSEMDKLHLIEAMEPFANIIDDLIANDSEDIHHYDTVLYESPSGTYKITLGDSIRASNSISKFAYDESIPEIQEFLERRWNELKHDLQRGLHSRDEDED